VSNEPLYQLKSCTRAWPGASLDKVEPSHTNEHAYMHPSPIPPMVKLRPRILCIPINRVALSQLQPLISAPDQFLHWLTPYGLNKLAQFFTFLPPSIVAHEHIILMHAVKHKTLSNYSAGLLRFTQFCDHFNSQKHLGCQLQNGSFSLHHHLWCRFHWWQLSQDMAYGLGAMAHHELRTLAWHHPSEEGYPRL